MSKYDKKWREENPEKWRECNRINMAKWRKKNKEKVMINQMRYYMRRFPKIALETLVAQNSTSNNTGSLKFLDYLDFHLRCEQEGLSPLQGENMYRYVVEKLQAGA